MEKLIINDCIILDIIKFNGLHEIIIPCSPASAITPTIYQLNKMKCKIELYGKIYNSYKIVGRNYVKNLVGISVL